MIKFAYLKGAKWYIPAIPKMRSAANKAQTITAIESAAMHSPLCTAEILKVATWAVLEPPISSPIKQSPLQNSVWGDTYDPTTTTLV